jgi:ABC-type uncharacterized transport system substrate-binding protein
MRLIGLVLALVLMLTTHPIEAQQPAKVYRIGYLTPFPLGSPIEDLFRQGLRDLGYVEGRNLVIETRSAEQRYGDLPKLAAELVNANVDVIVAATGTTALAAKGATSTIPIVMNSADAVTQGIIASLARPGGNVTGVTVLSSPLAPKRLEILKEAVPRLRRAAALWCPEFPIQHVELQHTKAAAETLRFGVEFLEYRTPASWETAMTALRANRPDALVLLECPVLPLDAVPAFALQHRIPTMSPYMYVTHRGGLLSYGTNPQAMTRLMAGYVDKILKGAKPADLPVEQPTKFELVINLKTAKTLGLTIPPTLLQRADQLIE